MDQATMTTERKPKQKARVAKQVWLDLEQRHRLKSFAQRMHLSGSEVARRAIDAYISAAPFGALRLSASPSTGNGIGNCSRRR